MVLDTFKEENGWILSRWNLTYAANWKRIVTCISLIKDFYVKLSVICTINGEDREVSLSELMQINEGSALTARGLSKVVGVSLSITFYNQAQVVDVFIAQANDEFKSPSYESVSKSLGQYLDSLELYLFGE